MSLKRNAIKQTTTEIYLISTLLANIHKTIKTISFIAYAKANKELLRKVKYTARKLVATDMMLGIILDVSKKIKMK